MKKYDLIIKLKEKGMTYQAIAQVLVDKGYDKVSRQRVHQLYKRESAKKEAKIAQK